jgi:alcohol dehydrogenase class IV
VVDDPFDIDARSRMFRASVLGGRALLNATPGAAYALARLLAGRAGVGHGLATAVILAHTARFTADAVPEEAARIGDALGDADDLGGAVDRLRERIGIPASLADCGARLDDIDAVARMSQGQPEVANNPRPMTEDDVRAVLAAAF